MMLKAIEEVLEEFYKELESEDMTMEEMVNALDELAYRYEEEAKKKKNEKKHFCNKADCKTDENRETEKENDHVNHPAHYCSSGMECIDEMILLYGEEETMTFCKLNAHKYRKRALDKGGREDIEKSDWYIAKYKELKIIVDNKKVRDMQNIIRLGATLNIEDVSFIELYKKFIG